MIAADLGRAVILGSIPIAAVAGALTLAHLIVAAFLAAILSVFFDAASSAYLPAIVARARLVAANSALSASASVAEFTGFALGGDPRPDPDGPDRDRRRCGLVRRLGRAPRLDPPAGGRASAGRGPRAGPARDPGGDRRRRRQPDPAGARVRPCRDAPAVGRLRGDLPALRDQRASGSGRRRSG